MRDSTSAQPSVTGGRPVLPSSLDGLVLSPLDFPPGTTMMPDARNELLSLTDEFGAEVAGAQVDPVGCHPQQGIDYMGIGMEGLLSNGAVAAAMSKTAAYSNIVSARLVDLRRVIEFNTRCASTTTIASDLTRNSIEVEMLPAPAGLDGMDTVVYRTALVSDVGDGQPTSSIVYEGWAIASGTTVWVRVLSSNESSDRDTFVRLFLTAVNKVRYRL